MTFMWRSLPLGWENVWAQEEGEEEEENVFAIVKTKTEQVLNFRSRRLAEWESTVILSLLFSLSCFYALLSNSREYCACRGILRRQRSHCLREVYDWDEKSGASRKYRWSVKENVPIENNNMFTPNNNNRESTTHFFAAKGINKRSRRTQ